jgi:hypothetical protein
MTSSNLFVIKNHQLINSCIIKTAIKGASSKASFTERFPLDKVCAAGSLQPFDADIYVTSSEIKGHVGNAERLRLISIPVRFIHNL